LLPVVLCSIVLAVRDDASFGELHVRQTSSDILLQNNKVSQVDTRDVKEIGEKEHDGETNIEEVDQIETSHLVNHKEKKLKMMDQSLTGKPTPYPTPSPRPWNYSIPGCEEETSWRVCYRKECGETGYCSCIVRRGRRYDRRRRLCSRLSSIGPNHCQTKCRP